MTTRHATMRASMNFTGIWNDLPDTLTPDSLRSELTDEAGFLFLCFFFPAIMWRDVLLQHAATNYAFECEVRWRTLVCFCILCCSTGGEGRGKKIKGMFLNWSLFQNLVEVNSPVGLSIEACDWFIDLSINKTKDACTSWEACKEASE